MTVWLPFPPPAGLFDDVSATIEVCPSPDEMPSDPAGVEVFVPPFAHSPAVVGMLGVLPDLRMVQLLSAGADAWAGRVPDGVTLCDARGVHSSSTAEWALTAILCHLREFPAFVRAQERRHWLGRNEMSRSDELTGKRVLIVGAGSIGEALARRLIACEATVVKVARTARDGVHGIDELPGLLPEADIVVLLLPLTAETTGMVDAAFLARMRDGSLLVNASRGPVVDTGALLAEVASGRLGVAMDVTDPEPLPSDHPLWSLANVLITPHVGGAVRGLPARAARLVHDQLVRLERGEPPINIVANGY